MTAFRRSFFLLTYENAMLCKNDYSDNIIDSARQCVIKFNCKRLKQIFRTVYEQKGKGFYKKRKNRLC